MNVVANEKTATIPSYLRDAHYKGAAKLGMESVINIPMIIKITM